MPSLKRKLMLGIAAVTTIVLLSSAGAVYLLARTSLRAEFDANTMAKARAISTMVELHHGQIKYDELAEANLQEFSRADHPEYYQLWLTDGKTLTKSASLGEAELRPLPPETSTSVTLADGRIGRQSALRFEMHQ